MLFLLDLPFVFAFNNAQEMVLEGLPGLMSALYKCCGGTRPYTDVCCSPEDRVHLGV